MNRTFHRNALVVATLVLFLTPLGSANCIGWVEGGRDAVCSRNPITSPNDPCGTIVSGGNLDVRGAAFTSFGSCQDELSGGPLDCNSSAGTISSSGATSFPTVACTGSYGCWYHIWATQTGGVEVSGWGLGACTDRDDSGGCTDIGSNFDDFSERDSVGDVLSGEEPSQSYPGYTYVAFCVRSDTAGAGGGFDDMFVFINSWADENILLENEGGGPENLGSGVGIGTYDVWVELGAPVDSEADCPHTGD